MRLAVVVPSAEYKSYAGARIRYGRIAPELAKLGIELTVDDIAQFNPGDPRCELLLVSKCHDARALVVAALCSQSGVRVGVDLFDDYFSQVGDSRLARYRGWLAQLVGMCDFALCSTPAMAAIAKSYRADISVHVMNDPAPEVDAKKLSTVLARKAAAARDSRSIRVAWFGVGDNPNFPVGLDDLAAFGHVLRGLGATGMNVELRVLTNVRALTADRLASIRGLPVSVVIDEWTEQRERALLRDSFAVFLPVNAQPFSTAKSLNRAVTGLAGGCQLLCAGYPLYEPFQPLLYRDPGELLRDLESDSLRHSPDRLDLFVELVATLASAEAEAARLAGFLEALEAPAPQRLPVALIHGHSTNGLAHKLVQAAGGLSIASPLATAPLGYDVVFREAASGLRMLVSKKAARSLRPDFAASIQAAADVDDRKLFEISDLRDKAAETVPGPSGEPSLPFQLAINHSAIDEVRRRVENCFGPCRILVSESSHLPFAVPSEG